MCVVHPPRLSLPLSSFYNVATDCVVLEACSALYGHTSTSKWRRPTSYLFTDLQRGKSGSSTWHRTRITMMKTPACPLTSTALLRASLQAVGAIESDRDWNPMFGKKYRWRVFVCFSAHRCVFTDTCFFYSFNSKVLYSIKTTCLIFCLLLNKCSDRRHYSSLFL